MHIGMMYEVHDACTGLTVVQRSIDDVRTMMEGMHNLAQLGIVEGAHNLVCIGLLVVVCNSVCMDL